MRMAAWLGLLASLLGGAACREANRAAGSEAAGGAGAECAAATDEAGGASDAAGTGGGRRPGAGCRPPGTDPAAAEARRRAVAERARLVESLDGERRALFAQAEALEPPGRAEALRRAADEAAGRLAAIPGWHAVEPDLLRRALADAAFYEVLCRAAGAGVATCAEADDLWHGGGGACRTSVRTLRVWHERAAADGIDPRRDPARSEQERERVAPLWEAIVDRRDEPCERLDPDHVGPGAWPRALCRAAARRDPEPCAAVEDPWGGRRCRAFLAALPDLPPPAGDPLAALLRAWAASPPEVSACGAVVRAALESDPALAAAFTPGAPVGPAARP